MKMNCELIVFHCILGVGIAAMGPMNPEAVMKNIIPVGMSIILLLHFNKRFFIKIITFLSRSANIAIKVIRYLIMLTAI